MSSKATQFKPGNCANPGGRPKVVAEVRELARQYTQQAITTLAEICTNADAPPASRVAAASTLLDRGYGKPLQQVEVFKSPLEALTADELQRIVDALTPSAGSDESGGIGASLH